VFEEISFIPGEDGQRSNDQAVATVRYTQELVENGTGFFWCDEGKEQYTLQRDGDSWVILSNVDNPKVSRKQ
jgi:hypothetical protein